MTLTIATIGKKIHEKELTVADLYLPFINFEYIKRRSNERVMDELNLSTWDNEALQYEICSMLQNYLPQLPQDIQDTFAPYMNEFEKRFGV